MKTTKHTIEITDRNDENTFMVEFELYTERIESYSDFHQVDSCYINYCCKILTPLSAVDYETATIAIEHDYGKKEFDEPIIIPEKKNDSLFQAFKGIFKS